MDNTFSEVKVKPVVKFNWAFIGAGLMHLVFLICFLIMGLYIMAQINVVSLAVYTAATICTRKNAEKYAYRWVIVFFVEVLLYAVLSTLMQGVEVCFFLYPLMAMPIYGYLLFAFCDKSRFIRTSVLMALITFVTGFIVLFFVDHIGTIYTLTDMRILTRGNILLLRSVNIGFATIMLLVFTLVFYVELMRTLNLLQDSNKKLDYTATHDALTGLSNRYSLWNFFEQLENSGDEYCIFMGDVDDFKKINDTYGHDCGDKVLKAISGIMLDNTDSIRDIACRWGGEEMLVVMRGSREECLKTVHNIKDMISALDITENGKRVKVSMTFGFVGGTEIEELRTNSNAADNEAPIQHEIDNLISVADKRLYVGKRSGKNVIIAA